MNSAIKYFETANRKLEQFLFMHDIMFYRFYTNEDGLTTWVYVETEETRRVVEEFRAIQKKKRERRAS